jgi:hypothetical protein
MIKVTLIIVLVALVSVSQQLDKRPSWAVGRSAEDSYELPSFQDWFTLHKKPSWAVGRDLEAEEGAYSGLDKRIIEFKRSGHEQDWESEHKSRGKRPSIGRTRSVGH